jgi:NAD(P)-dependent dehydrogenase (short-subunit alcohol dehydrogenase family)
VTAEFAGKVAVVTGGGSGLGAAMCAAFAQVGMGVAALDIDASAAEATAKAISEQHGVPTTSVRVDIGNGESIRAAAAHVDQVLGGCDVLCANVGVQQFGAVDKLSDEDWEWVLQVNVLGTIRTVRAFLPLIRARDGFRRIVLTASSSVLAPAVRLAAYQTSKFAVQGFGETLREELADEGIGVTVLFPGGMATRHLESSVLARPAELGPTSVDQDDLMAMINHRPVQADEVVTPEHAIRHLVQDLRENVPYSLTHGSFRPYYQQRRDAMDAAFDRMEAS